ncbi:MAG: 2-hydroxyacyl-CoA dehydratase family protein [Deltaproteobacteria bacterium]
MREPAVLNTEQARTYMIAVLKKFRQDLGHALEIEISMDRLLQSVRTYNQIRSLLQKLQDVRKTNPKQLTAENFHRILTAACPSFEGSGFAP